MCGEGPIVNQSTTSRRKFPRIRSVRHLFISDLHLDAASPETVAIFMRFLENEARAAASLHILGDLFETWIGDDDPDPVRDAACVALRNLASTGVSVYVMRGNRDFLYGADFEQRTGCTLLPDPVVVTLLGEKVLLTHGDLLCTGDHAYQELRTTVRDPAFRDRVLRLPIEARQLLASAARAGSKAHVSAASATIGAATIMDVAPEAVIAAFETSGTRTMIHGHTHRPATHQHDVAGEPATRHVLADWGSTGEYLEVSGEGWRRRVVP